MEEFLRKLYRRYLKFEKQSFIIDAKKHSTSLKRMKLSDKILFEFYDNYYKIPFLSFLENVKTIIYSKSVFDFITKELSEDWDLWRYLKFMTDEKIIKVSKTGRVFLLKKEIEEIIPKPQTSQEIKRKLERKLNIKIKEKEPVINLFEKFQDFSVKAKWDQMPISAESAIFIVEKILKHISKNKKFLFVGDDDFISVILTLVEPNIECLVIDIDKELISCINNLASRFSLKIQAKEVDIRKQKFLGEKFVGFLTNPVYTEAGVKKSLMFAKNHLGKDGGIGFLEVGDEAIGKRFLFLQEFFAKNNLIIDELITNKIYYPHIMLYKEDKEIFKRLSSMINKKIIRKSPKLGASLYIFEYIPFKPKKIKLKKSIYAYL
ncbi:MAG: bis-aminopropyl spermidine synthase family protein [Candidatus Nealsonbacteria bacterium]